MSSTNTEKEMPPVLESEAKESELTELQDVPSSATRTSDEHRVDGVQIVDGDGNIIHASVDHLLAVGIDPNNMTDLTESQLTALIRIATTATDLPSCSTSKAPTDGSTQGGSTPPAGGNAQADEGAAGASGDDITMVIGDDGSLRLIDPQQNTYLIPADQLIASGIDVNNMTEDQIQQIVQVAIPNYAADSATNHTQQHSNNQAVPTTSTDPHDAPASKRSKNDMNSYTDHHLHIASATKQQLRKGGNGALPGSNSVLTTFDTARSMMIGKRVDVSRPGQHTQAATVKYCRPGAGYKVQFDDGHFEWVQQDQFNLRADEFGVTAKTDPQTDGVTNGVGASGVGRRIPPAIPGIKVGSQYNDGQIGVRSGSVSALSSEPNFCCPICDKKVYQKEPAYIVIRLPACDSCADGKILVIDQDDDAKDSATKTLPSATQ